MAALLLRLNNTAKKMHKNIHHEIHWKQERCTTESYAFDFDGARGG